MRNDISRFSQNPRANIRRSKMSRDSDYKTTLNAGVLVPFYVDDIMPGDTFDMSSRVLARMATPLYPVMDNAYLDTYFFFVPGRLVWEHFEEFHGASASAWDDGIDWEMPQKTVPLGGFELGSLADYFGIPTYAGSHSSTQAFNPKINVLPLRCYQKVWNDFFRDVNLMDEVKINLGDNGDADEHVNELLPVCKFHDYFTSALPQPQRGDPVSLDVFGSDYISVLTLPSANSYYSERPTGQRLRFGPSDGTNSMVNQEGKFYHDLLVGNFTGGEISLYAKMGDAVNDVASDRTGVEGLTPINLAARVAEADAVTINQLREAIQIQAVLEADARGGNRYTSLIRQHFGVISPDGRLQRAEYLGGERIPISVQDVTQTAPALAEGQRSLGAVGAYSKTVSTGGGFSKSFTEHGYLIGVMCIRTDRSYQQGLNRLWSKKKRFDYYLPELAHIGEQPVYNREIYWQGGSAAALAQNDEVFGYNEPWADYRYKPSLVTGYFRSNAAEHGGSLDAYHYSDNYNALPHLSASWIVEDPTIIDRTLQVASGVTHQFIVDMYFKCTATRPMPVYSIPGFGGHF